MPRVERKTVRFSRAKPTMRRVSRSGFQSRRRSAAGAGAGRTPRLASQPAPARREEEEGKREQAGAQVDERVLGEHYATHPEREQDDERVLEQVVVQGPQELGPEEGPEPSRPQQLELAHPLPRLISS